MGIAMAGGILLKNYHYCDTQLVIVDRRENYKDNILSPAIFYLIGVVRVVPKVNESVIITFYIRGSSLACL